MNQEWKNLTVFGELIGVLKPPLRHQPTPSAASWCVIPIPPRANGYLLGMLDFGDTELAIGVISYLIIYSSLQVKTFQGLSG